MLEMLVSASADDWLSLPVVDSIRSLWLLAAPLVDSSDAVPSSTNPQAAENTANAVKVPIKAVFLFI